MTVTKTPPTPISSPPGVRPLRKLVIGLVVVLVAATLLWKPAFKAMGAFLIVDEPPVASDVIAVAGGRIERAAYALDLIKKGVAGRILVLENPEDCPNFYRIRCDELIRERLKETGLRDDQIFIERRPHSTRTDALFAREVMEQEGMRSAVVVSEPFHMRRVALTWRKAFDSSGIRLTFSALPERYSKGRLDEWWSREYDLVFVFTEYAKLIHYWAKGFI